VVRLWDFRGFPGAAIAPEWQFSALAWTHGTHVIKTGIQFIQNKKNGKKDTSTNLVFLTSLWTPRACGIWDTRRANLLTGAVVAVPAGQHERTMYSIYRDVHFFIQDTWKATSS